MAKKIILLMIIFLWLLCGILIYLMKDSKAPTTRLDQACIAFTCLAETLSEITKDITDKDI